MKNGCKKGKVGERELAHYLTKLGFPSTRGQQHKGGPGSPDVICETLDHVHIECKRNEGIGLCTKLLDDAMAQATRDAGTKHPCVFWRRNNQAWAMTFPAREIEAWVTVAGDDNIREALTWLENRE